MVRRSRKATRKLAETVLSPLSCPDEEHQRTVPSSLAATGEQRAGPHDAAHTSGDLAGVLETLATCFDQCARTTALEMLLFGVRHLFESLADLHLQWLPALSQATQPLVSGARPPDDLPSRHAIWLYLRSIRRGLEQIDVLCTLLIQAIGGLLDELDNAAEPATAPDLLSPAQCQHCEQSLAVLNRCLLEWQEAYQRLTPFAVQFMALPQAPVVLTRLDQAFASLLEEAETIFGDVLPAVQMSLIDAVASALFLLDLAQHVEQVRQVLTSLSELLEIVSEAVGIETLL